ncbi:MAG: nitrate/nitrite transporter NrtS [Gammaproteobacteria bacterium]
MDNIWLKHALNPKIVQRSVKTSLIVGTVLILINYGSSLTEWATFTSSWWKIGLTYWVPYLVSTYSAVGSLVDRSKD